MDPNMLNDDVIFVLRQIRDELRAIRELLKQQQIENRRG